MAQMIPQQLAKVLYGLTHDATPDQLEERINAFIHMVRAQQMTRKMPYIIEAFVAYTKKKEGIVTLNVTSAHPLSDRVLKAITEQFDGTVEMQTQVEPEIIGGVVIQAGNTILDGSIRTQLTQMQRHL